MSGTEITQEENYKKMKDIPRSSGNSFIIYTCSKTQAKVFQAPTFSAVTGIASVSGNLDNENISIVWKDGNWKVTCKKTAVWGQYSFNVAVKSKGSDTRLQETSNFTMQVYLQAVDENFQFFYFQYRVGDKVDITIEQDTVGEVLSYGTRGQLFVTDLKDTDKRYGSGLYLSLRSMGDIDVPKLTGTASRPGVYLAAVHCATDDYYSPDGRDYFSGGNDLLAPVVVAIRDKDYEENQLMVVTDNTVTHNENSLRLIYCDDGLFPNKGGNFSVAMSGGNGQWTGRHEEQAQTQIIVTEYQIVLDGEQWQLQRREYMQSDEKIPDYETISKVKQIKGCNIPPSAGWSKGAVIAGDTWYYLPQYGLFDYKGVTEDENQLPIYQQQTMFTKQYDGWKDRNKEYKNDDGLILKQKLIDDVLTWCLFSNNSTETPEVEDVEPKTISGCIVPYSPPTVEKYGSKAVRDIAFDNISIHTAPGEVALASGGIAGGFWRWPDERKHLVPYNGTSGDVDCYMGAISVTLEKYSFYEKRAKNENTWLEGLGEYNKQDTQTERKQGVKLQWGIDRRKLEYSRRDGDAFAWLMTAAKPNTNWEHTWEGSYSGAYQAGFYNGLPGDKKDPVMLYNATSEGTYTKGDETLTESDQPSNLMFYIFGGADYAENKWHNIWNALRWHGGGVSGNFQDKEVIKTHYDNEGGDEYDYDEEFEYTYGGNISFTPNFFTLIPRLVKLGEDLEVETQTVKNEESTFTCYIYKYHDNYSDIGDYISTQVKQRYELTIAIKRTYTVVNGKEITNSLKATETLKEVKPGTYTSQTWNTTVIEYTEENLPDFEDKMQKCKDDVASCELPAKNTYGDEATGYWTWEGSREEFKISTSEG